MDKRWLSCAEQVELLHDRGMIVSDPASGFFSQRTGSPRSTANPSSSLFYWVKLGTRGVLFALTLLYLKSSTNGGGAGN